MKPAGNPVLFSISAICLLAALAAGCADTTEQKIKHTTDAAITDTADAMNKIATDVKNISTNVATHVADFSTNAWAKTRQGAQKVVQVTTNAVHDIK